MMGSKGRHEATGGHAPIPAEAGFFGPGSMTWRVGREWVLHLGTLRAVLMQLAHPKVAQGVADHSDFQRAFLQRALNTHRAANELVFGDRETASRRAAKLHAMHSRVRGRIAPAATGTPEDTYAALDQDLLTWVYGTLVDTIIVTHDTFLNTMGEDDWERYYQESKRLASLLSIDTSRLPKDLAAFKEWMDGTLASDQIKVTPSARALSHALREGKWFLRLARPVHYTIAAGSLPARLRDEYGYAGNRATRYAYQAVAGASRAVLPRLPALVRGTPQAWLAERRIKAR